MSVNVRIHPYLSKFTNGQKIVKATGKTVGECIDALDIKFPGLKEQLLDKQGNLDSLWEIYINSYSSYPEELTKPVNDGDELIIVALIGGG